MSCLIKDFLEELRNFYKKTGIMGKIAIRSLLMSLLFSILALFTLVNADLFIYVYEHSVYVYLPLLATSFVSFLLVWVREYFRSIKSRI